MWDRVGRGEGVEGGAMRLGMGQRQTDVM